MEEGGQGQGAGGGGASLGRGGAEKGRRATWSPRGCGRCGTAAGRTVWGRAAVPAGSGPRGSAQSSFPTRGPPGAHLPTPSPQRRTKRTPGEGISRPLGSVTRPCHCFHIPGNQPGGPPGQPIGSTSPSGRPYCNWFAAVSVTESPAPHHADSATIGPRLCPSPEAYLDLPDANGDGSGGGETFDDRAGDEVQQEPWGPRGTLSWSRRPWCMEAGDGRGLRGGVGRAGAESVGAHCLAGLESRRPG